MTRKGSQFQLTVHVTPNSKAPGIEVEADGTVHVNLAAPPREGMANLELCQVLAKALHVPKTALEVVAGSKGRDKVVLLPETLDATTILERLRAAG